MDGAVGAELPAGVEGVEGVAGVDGVAGASVGEAAGPPATAAGKNNYSLI